MILSRVSITIESTGIAFGCVADCKFDKLRGRLEMIKKKVRVFSHDRAAGATSCVEIKGISFVFVFALQKGEKRKRHDQAAPLRVNRFAHEQV